MPQPRTITLRFASYSGLCHAMQVYGPALQVLGHPIHNPLDFNHDEVDDTWFQGQLEVGYA